MRIVDSLQITIRDNVTNKSCVYPNGCQGRCSPKRGALLQPDEGDVVDVVGREARMREDRLDAEIARLLERAELLIGHVIGVTVEVVAHPNHFGIDGAAREKIVPPLGSTRLDASGGR